MAAAAAGRLINAPFLGQLLLRRRRPPTPDASRSVHSARLCAVELYVLSPSPSRCPRRRASLHTFSGTLGAYRRLAPPLAPQPFALAVPTAASAPLSDSARLWHRGAPHPPFSLLTSSVPSFLTRQLLHRRSSSRMRLDSHHEHRRRHRTHRAAPLRSRPHLPGHFLPRHVSSAHHPSLTPLSPSRTPGATTEGAALRRWPSLSPP